MAQDSDIFPEGPLELPGEPARHSQVAGTRGRRFPLKKVLFILVSILILAGIGFGVWKFLLTPDNPPPENAAQTTETDAAVPAGAVPSDVPEATELKDFKADRPRVAFSYPRAWTVNESEDGIRIVSPDFAYQTTAGEEVAGHFRIYIRQGARKADSEYIGRGVAVQPSEKLHYTDPAPGQRAETNLSFFGLDTPDQFAYFFIAGNYDLDKGDTLGPDYGKETETYIIAGGYSSADLKDDLATHQVSLDYFQQTNAYAQALDILRSLQVL